MIKFRKGELRFYKSMNPIELAEYLKNFLNNEEYVIKFLENHKYNWLKKEWTKTRTI